MPPVLPIASRIVVLLTAAAHRGSEGLHREREARRDHPRLRALVSLTSRGRCGLEVAFWYKRRVSLFRQVKPSGPCDMQDETVSRAADVPVGKVT